MLRVFTTFSGYDAQCMALDNLKAKYNFFDYDLVGWSEIDKAAIKAHNAVYPQWADRNYGDITKINWEEVPDFDLFTYSSPCQDFSNAGLQKGGEEGSGTRSSLLWECKKAIIIKRPRWAVLENVKALTQEKFMPLFQKWIATLKTYGYVSHWQIINSKYYGIPQNRERVFLVSQYIGLGFPQAFALTDDTLEEKIIKQDEVIPKKYYVKKEFVDKAISLLSDKPENMIPHIDEECFLKNAPTYWNEG